MRNKIAALAALLTLSLLACLTAPEEPGTNNQPLTCAQDERAFNGACRTQCTRNSDCKTGLSCMNVGGGSPLCLDYTRCAYLESDTECSPLDGAGGSYDPYGGSGGYYSESGCVGDAVWKLARKSGDPACGGEHVVSRCALTPSGCALVHGSTFDIADP